MIITTTEAMGYRQEHRRLGPGERGYRRCIVRISDGARMYAGPGTDPDHPPVAHPDWVALPREEQRAIRMILDATDEQTGIADYLSERRGKAAVACAAAARGIDAHAWRGREADDVRREASQAEYELVRGGTLDQARGRLIDVFIACEFVRGGSLGTLDQALRQLVDALGEGRHTPPEASLERRCETVDDTTWYAVIGALPDGRHAAVALSVLLIPPRPPMARFVDLHVEDPAGVPSRWLHPRRDDDGPRQFLACSASVAADLYRDHGNPHGVEQTPAFWSALGDLFRKWTADLEPVDVSGAAPAVSVLDESPVSSIGELAQKYGPRGASLLIRRALRFASSDDASLGARLVQLAQDLEAVTRTAATTATATQGDPGPRDSDEARQRLRQLCDEFPDELTWDAERYDRGEQAREGESSDYVDGYNDALAIAREIATAARGVLTEPGGAIRGEDQPSVFPIGAALAIIDYVRLCGESRCAVDPEVLLVLIDEMRKKMAAHLAEVVTATYGSAASHLAEVVKHRTVASPKEGSRPPPSLATPTSIELTPGDHLIARTCQGCGEIARTCQGCGEIVATEDLLDVTMHCDACRARRGLPPIAQCRLAVGDYVEFSPDGPLGYRWAQGEIVRIHQGVVLEMTVEALGDRWAPRFQLAGDPWAGAVAIGSRIDPSFDLSRPGRRGTLWRVDRPPGSRSRPPERSATPTSTPIALTPGDRRDAPVGGPDEARPLAAYLRELEAKATAAHRGEPGHAVGPEVLLALIAKLREAVSLVDDLASLWGDMDRIDDEVADRLAKVRTIQGYEETGP